MDPPKCSLHPHGRVRKDGFYGKHRQYQRWQCVPGNGAPPHMVRAGLPRKRLGGREGHCPTCGRPWNDGDGVRKARDDFFTLQDKVQGLLHLARGESYRQAAFLLRKDVAFAPSRKRSGRLTRDWVSQYADILADHFLETSWPEVLVLDEVPFHGSTKNGKPSGRLYFTVFGAMSYNDGTLRSLALGASQRTPRLWRLGAAKRSDAASWLRFLAQLDGEPLQVICDRKPQMRRAVRHLWSYAQIYACSEHLRQNVESRLPKTGRASLLQPLLDEHTFAHPYQLGRFRAELARLLELGTRLPKKQRKALQELEGWFRSNEDDITRTVHHFHRPVSTGGLERPLREVKNSLYDRRKNFTNLPRLNDLLSLMTLNQRGQVQAQEWVAALRENHRQFKGKPPPRRKVDKTVKRL